ncbi:MAG: NAD(P)H-hydrate epimerase, partial [Chitinophagaceae bacterium]|nr:NAD(P)H-hydrate epimerase [Chitinophagaceae bacterium]
MKIFSSAKIKDWDNYTINHEPITSNELMERAARACYQWLVKNYSVKNVFKIFCGKGNNGGDGLAIARMLIESKFDVSVYILESGRLGTDDFQNNIAWLYTHTDNIQFIDSEECLPQISNDNIVIDALLGTGLNKPVEKIFKSVINHINKSGAKIISIDIPGGLYADKSSQQNVVINADYTLTFQQHKLAFFMAE